MKLELMGQMFWEFMKIGFFAVGGGPATLPYLMDLTEKFDWYTMEELTNMIKFQQAYNASARYISVVNQMLEHLLNSLG